MVDNNVEEFFELDVGYEQQVGGDGVYPVHAYDVNCVLKCISAAKRRQWRLQAKVKNTRHCITMLRNEVTQMERYLHKLEIEEDCQGTIVDIMKSLCLKDDTASVSDGMEDDNDVNDVDDDDDTHELVPDVIDLSHDDDHISDEEEDENVMKEHGAIDSLAEKQYDDYKDKNLSH
jgi:hypothetical protein